MFSNEPQNAVKLRLFGNAFGPWTSTQIREITSVDFHQANIVLTLNSKAHGVATIELAPGFEYVQSTVNGTQVDSSTIKVGRIITLTDAILTLQKGENKILEPKKESSNTTIQEKPHTLTAAPSGSSVESENHKSPKMQAIKISIWLPSACLFLVILFLVYLKLK